jgi:hypothetical protein
MNKKPKLFPLITKHICVNEKIKPNIQNHFNLGNKNIHLIKFFLMKSPETNAKITVKDGDNMFSFEWCENFKNTHSNIGNFYLNRNKTNGTQCNFSIIKNELNPIQCLSITSSDIVTVVDFNVAILQKFSINTFDEIYQVNPAHFSKIINRSSFLNFDDQSEKVLTDVCNDGIIEEVSLLSQRYNDKYYGLLSYMKLMNKMYYSYDERVDSTSDGKHIKLPKYTLTEIADRIGSVINEIEKWEYLFEDATAAIPTHQFTPIQSHTLSSLQNNKNTLEIIINGNYAGVDPHIFNTRSIESYFGYQRSVSKRTTALDYIRSHARMKQNTIEDESVNTPYNNKKKRKYLQESTSPQNKITTTEYVNKYKNSKSRFVDDDYDSFTPEQLHAAKELKYRFLEQRFNTIRQSFHQRSTNSSSLSTSYQNNFTRYNINTMFEEVQLQEIQYNPGTTQRFLDLKVEFTNDTKLKHKEMNIPCFLRNSPINLKVYSFPPFESLKVHLICKDKDNDAVSTISCNKFTYSTNNQELFLQLQIVQSLSNKRLKMNIRLNFDNSYTLSHDCYVYAKKTNAVISCNTYDESSTQNSDSQFNETQEISS